MAILCFAQNSQHPSHAEDSNDIRPTSDTEGCISGASGPHTAAAAASYHHGHCLPEPGVSESSYRREPDRSPGKHWRERRF